MSYTCLNKTKVIGNKQRVKIVFFLIINKKQRQTKNMSTSPVYSKYHHNIGFYHAMLKVKNRQTYDIYSYILKSVCDSSSTTHDKKKQDLNMSN